MYYKSMNNHSIKNWTINTTINTTIDTTMRL